MMTTKYELDKDVLTEIKNFKEKGAVWGIRNASVVAYVYYFGEPRYTWEYRYSVAIEVGDELVGGGGFSNNLIEAKKMAIDSVKSHLFRHSEKEYEERNKINDKYRNHY